MNLGYVVGYVAGLMLLMFFFFFFIEKKEIKIKLSSTYFYVLFLTLLFVKPDKLSHAFFVLTWSFAYLIGVLTFNNKRFSPISVNLRVFVIILFCFLFLFIGINNLSKFASISLSEFFSLHEKRSEVEISYFEYLFTRSLFLFPFLYLLAYFKKNIFMLLLTIILTFMISLTSLQKSPIVFAIFGIFVFFALRKGNHIDLIKVFYIILAFVLSLTLVSLMMYQAKLDDTFFAVLNRIFHKPGWLAFQAMQMIDDFDKFYYGGASFLLVLKALGSDVIQLGKENYYYVYGNYFGSANTPCFTGAYADFGFGGIFYAFILGSVFRVYDNTILSQIPRVRNKSAILAAYSTSVILSLKMNVTVMGSALLGEGLFFSMLTAYVMTYHVKRDSSSKQVQHN